MKQNNLWILVLITIIITGATLRLVGINWDQNQHLHPDERFLTMVTQALTWPKSFTMYFSTSTSPANPNNYGYPFYVYGTFPLFITKIASQLVNLDSYNGITLVGRFLSAGFDTLIIYFVWGISLNIFKNKITAILSAFFYSICVLPIQLAHFYAVDTFMVACLYGSIYLLHKYLQHHNFTHSLVLVSLTGFIFGLSASSKISALLFLPIVAGFFVFKLVKTKNWFQVFTCGLIFSILTFISLHVAQPYLFNGFVKLNPKILASWQQLKSFDDPTGWFPPAVQWIRSIKILFPLENTAFWGLGLILFIVAVLGIVRSFFYLKNNPETGFHLLWILGLFIYQGLQFAKPIRYFYPFYPSLAVISGPVLYILLSRPKNILLKILVLLLLIGWPLSFISIYSRPHSRVVATKWIYSHIPSGSTLSCEHWDDCLPLGGSGPYKFVEFPLYNPDSPQKVIQIQSLLKQTDYLILSSNRLYGSIMTVPEKYPITTKFYSDLFSGRLGFSKIAEFSSRPNLPLPGFQFCLTPWFVNYGKIAFPSQECPLPGVSFVDDYADELWTVYDHPKVIIFKKT